MQISLISLYLVQTEKLLSYNTNKCVYPDFINLHTHIVNVRSSTLVVRRVIILASIVASDMTR